MQRSDADASQPYFARPLVQLLVLGAFAVLTVPIATAVLASDGSAMRWVPYYGVTFGLTHFLTTGLIYLDSSNLRYFNSSLRNRLIYFAVPLAIFAAFAFVAATGLRRSNEWLDAGLFQLVFLANFFHVSRQSFGVLQLFKSAAGGIHGEVLRTAENMFFLGLALLQAEMLWMGQSYAPENLGVQITTGLVGGLFCIIAGSHAQLLWSGPRRRRGWVPLLYFVLQSTAGGLAVWKTSLYPIALAMHYVEYHVVMMPRVFDAPVDPARRADRYRRLLSRSKPFFYAGLLAVAWSLWFTQRTQLYLDPTAASLPLRLALHALDGIFLVHFFIEAFVWKFSTPHYRDTLLPLYGAKKARRSGAPS